MLSSWTSESSAVLMPPALRWTSCQVYCATFVSATLHPWFIRKWELKACSLCQFYFKDLLRHSKCSGRPPSHSARAHNPPDGASVGHAAIGGQGSASERVSASEQTDASVEEVPLSGDDTPESEGLPAYPTTAADAERKAWSLVESLDWD